MPFDALKYIAMVSMLTSYPFVVSVVPNSPYRTLGDLVAHARANPGKLNYPSAGVGTVHHLSGELFNALAGTDIQHIPYKGGNAPLTETLAGRADVLFEAMTLSIGQVRAGKLRPLAVTSRERWKALPDTPAASETAARVRGHLVHRAGRHRRHSGAGSRPAERRGAQGARQPGHLQALRRARRRARGEQRRGDAALRPGRDRKVAQGDRPAQARKAMIPVL
jgi:hypothetical protein